MNQTQEPETKDERNLITVLISHYLRNDGEPVFLPRLTDELIFDLRRWADEVFCPVAKRCGWIPKTECFDWIAFQWLNSIPIKSPFELADDDDGPNEGKGIPIKPTINPALIDGGIARLCGMDVSELMRRRPNRRW